MTQLSAPGESINNSLVGKSEALLQEKVLERVISKDTIPQLFKAPENPQWRLTINKAEQQSEGVETNEEKPLGFEVVSLAGFPRDKDGNIEYEGQKLSSKLDAMIRHGGVAPDYANGTGFKGLRKGEVVDTGKLTARFGQEASFSVALDEEGTVMVENADPDTALEIAQIVESEKTIDETPMPEEATEEIDETETEPTNEEVPVEAEPAVEAAEKEEVNELFNETDSLNDRLKMAKDEFDRQVASEIDTTESDFRRGERMVGSALDESERTVGSAMMNIGEQTNELTMIAGRLDGGMIDARQARLALDEVVSQLHRSKRQFDQASESLEVGQQRLVRMDTSIQDTVETIHTKEGQFGAFVEETAAQSNDREGVSMPDKDTTDAIKQLNDLTASQGDLVAAISRIKLGTGDFANRVSGHIRQIDSIIGNSQYGEMDPAELRRLSSELSELSQDRTLQRKYTEAFEPLGGRS